MSDAVTGPDAAVERAKGAADAAHDAVDRAADCAVSLVRKIQERPFCSLAIAFVAGVCCGLCARR